MRRSACVGLLALLSIAPAHISVAWAQSADRCELDSECGEGEQCRLQQCMPRKPLQNLVPDEPEASTARPLSRAHVCMTPVMICPLPGDSQSGTICYCNTGSGPVGGLVP